MAFPKLKKCGGGSTPIIFKRTILGGLIIQILVLARLGMVRSWRIVYGKWWFFLCYLVVVLALSALPEVLDLLL
jgi:hypothetical protein